MTRVCYFAWFVIESTIGIFHRISVDRFHVHFMFEYFYEYDSRQSKVNKPKCCPLVACLNPICNALQEHQQIEVVYINALR